MQVHGGVGYTREHGLHCWLRRACSGDAFMGPFGDPHEGLAELRFGQSFPPRTLTLALPW
jgi:alkylation response protein AidB-like acyl-CoA dehydrogenase